MTTALSATELRGLAPDLSLRVQVLGSFRVWSDGVEVDAKAWGREKALHPFQFLVTLRGGYLHKEQIVDRMWPALDSETGGALPLPVFSRLSSAHAQRWCRLRPFLTETRICDMLRL